MHNANTARRRLRILVVDDNRDAADMLSALLELNGHQTATAHNGLDAVAEANRERYDAVVLDLSMPHMDGFEAAALLQQLEPAPLLIACTAQDDAESRRRTADLGFSAHLIKPVPIDVMEAALISSRRPSQSGLTQQVAHPNELGQ
jgi:CheY-like chemotaxis protein